MVAGCPVDTAWSCWAGSRSLVPAQHHHLCVCDGLGLTVSGNGGVPPLPASWGVTARLRIALPAPWHAAQSCRQPCLHKGASRPWQGNRHHCLSVCDGLGGQSVGKAGYRHAKAIGNGSLSHRAGSPNPTPVHHLQRRQNYITPHCPQCPPVSR